MGLALLSAAALTLAPRQATAAGCCASAGMGDVGRLQVGEAAAVGLRSTFEQTFGRWWPDATWVPYPEDAVEREWRLELWTMAALTQDAALWVSMPWVFLHKEFPPLEQHGSRWGDFSMGWRQSWRPIVNRARAPGVSTNFSIRAPAGRPLWESADPLGADVTSRGDWELTGRTELEWVFSPGFVRAGFGVGWGLPFTRGDNDKRQRFGVTTQTDLIAGSEIGRVVVLAASVGFATESPLFIEGVRIDESAQRSLSVGVAGSFRLGPYWTLQSSLGTQPMFSGLGKNRPGTVSASLGLRYGIYPP